MMQKHRRCSFFLLLALAAALLAGCGAAKDAQAPSESSYTGFLENQKVIVAPEISGKLSQILVDEGDMVRAGEVVARLDDSLIRLKLAQADADVAEAEAKLAQLKAAVRPEEVARAEARVAQARAGVDAAESALQDAIQIRDNPQELDVQIAQAQASLAEAQAHADAAQYQAQAADIEARMWGDIARDLSQKQKVTLPNGTVIEVDAPPGKKQQAYVQWNLASQKAWRAWADAAQAKAAADQARVALQDLQRQRSDRQDAEARVTAATNARDQAKAALAQAQAALDAVKAGPSQGQIAAAEAAVQQAQAARDAQAVQLEKTTLLAPVDGVISARYFSVGEVIGSDQRLFAISQPTLLTITIYAPASMIDQIQINERYPLVIANAPGKRYQAQVTAISDEPEFTLSQSQNNAERAAVVYAVTLQVRQPDDSLRPGLPAEVLIPTHTP